jgi:hypothetical protein
MIGCLPFGEVSIDPLIPRDTIAAGKQRSRIVNQVGVGSVKKPKISHEDKSLSRE